MDELTIPRLGRGAVGAGSIRSASLLAAGATLAMGSDWAVSTADPLLEMEVAVTRVATTTVASDRRSSRPSGST